MSLILHIEFFPRQHYFLDFSANIISNIKCFYIILTPCIIIGTAFIRELSFECDVGMDISNKI